MRKAKKRGKWSVVVWVGFRNNRPQWNEIFTKEKDALYWKYKDGKDIRMCHLSEL